MELTFDRRILLGKDEIAFSLERTRRQKTIALSYGADGLRILAPADAPFDEIDGKIREKTSWILKKRALYEEINAEPVRREFISGESFTYIGRQYRLKVVQTTGKVTNVSLKGRHFVASVEAGKPPETQCVSVRGGMRRWYQKHAAKHLPVQVAKYAAMLNLPMPPVLISDQEKRWGSCTKEGNIRLNWQLVMAPMSLIEYVVAHEVGHLVEHNHSPSFWRVIERIQPDFASRRESLRREGHRFVF